MLELGDGLLGAYGVEAILSDKSISDALSVVILCANDPVSAWGGAKILRDNFAIEPAVVTGPATDNAVGVDQISERISLPAINALSNGVALGDLVGRTTQWQGGLMSTKIQAVVLGATGYVGGELLRIIAAHPELQFAAAVSESRGGEKIAATFANLAPAYGEQCFVEHDKWISVLESGSRLALFSAAPHGASAAVIAKALGAAAKKDIKVHVVDSSADFRYPNQRDYESVYGTEHGAPELLADFQSGVPEHVSEVQAAHVGHPGCFATAVLLATVPLIQSGLSDPEVFVNGITGSTGSGRSPQPGTHHPERHSNLYAYKPLAHRHEPEITALTEAATGCKNAGAFRAALGTVCTWDPRNRASEGKATYIKRAAA